MSTIPTYSPKEQASRAKPRSGAIAVMVAVLTVGLAAVGSAVPAAAQETKPNILTEQEAHAIAVDACLYLYPLVLMDVTRKQSTNIEPGKEFGKGPMNAFTNVPEYPPGNLRLVVRVNFDTPNQTKSGDRHEAKHAIS